MSSSIDTAMLDALCREDPLVFALSHVSLLDGKKWSIEDRKWIIEPYMVLNPLLIEKNHVDEPRQVAIRKSTQAGISTMSIAKALHFMSYWPVRVGYMLPRQQDISVFSMTRLDPIINNSPFLLSKLRQPNSTYIKTLDNSYLYFLEGSVEPRSIPIDMLLLDEVDLCNPDHVGTAINRMDASNWKLTIWLSTPTLPAIGIDAVYENSDQRVWMVKCPACGKWQDLDWEKNLRIEGPAADPHRVYYGCVSCGRPLSLQEIQGGQWVAQFPSRSKDLVGFHISQMMTIPAKDLYKHFRDPNQSIAEFYRKRLGKPYTMAGGSIEREDFMINCFDEPFPEETQWDSDSAYYIGVDQGNQLQVLVGKLERGRRRPKIVHIELIPFEEGFNRVGQLIQTFHARRCVIDGDPNRHPIRDLQKQFPGRVLMADYVEQRERFTKKVDTRKGSPTYTLPVAVTINRTDMFDDLIASIKDGLWALPGTPPNLPPGVETLIDHVTALKRDIEKRKTQSGEIEVGVWRKLRADHLAHAFGYLKVAMDLDRQADFRMAVIGGRTPMQQEQEQAKAADSDAPTPEVIAEVISRLAEVPEAQIKDHLEHHEEEGYTPPFPLRSKLKKMADHLSESDILWVMKKLVS